MTFQFFYPATLRGRSTPAARGDSENTLRREACPQREDAPPPRESMPPSRARLPCAETALLCCLGSPFRAGGARLLLAETTPCGECVTLSALSHRPKAPSPPPPPPLCSEAPVSAKQARMNNVNNQTHARTSLIESTQSRQATFGFRRERPQVAASRS